MWRQLKLQPPPWPNKPPPRPTKLSHSVQIVPLSAQICTEWRNCPTLEDGYRLAASRFQSGELLPLGGVIAVDIGDEVGAAKDVEADFAARRHWCDDGVGDGLPRNEVEV